MTRNLSRTRRFAHFLLLVAALLQVAAGAVGPWTHLVGGDRPSAPAWQATAPDAPDGGRIHTDGDCAVCHTLAAAAFLPSASAGPPLLSVRALSIPAHSEPGASPFVGFPSARSPPSL